MDTGDPYSMGEVSCSSAAALFNSSSPGLVRINCSSRSSFSRIAKLAGSNLYGGDQPWSQWTRASERASCKRGRWHTMTDPSGSLYTWRLLSRRTNTKASCCRISSDGLCRPDRPCWHACEDKRPSHVEQGVSSRPSHGCCYYHHCDSPGCCPVLDPPGDSAGLAAHRATGTRAPQHEEDAAKNRS